MSAYCARKVEALSPGKMDSESVEPTLPPKASDSEPICLTPTVPLVSLITETGIQMQGDVSLPTPQIHSSIREREPGSKNPKVKVTINAPAIEVSFSPTLEHRVLCFASTSSHNDRQPKPLSEEDMPMSCVEMGEQAISDPESVHYKRYTLADAFSAPVCNFAPHSVKDQVTFRQMKQSNALVVLLRLRFIVRSLSELTSKRPIRSVYLKAIQVFPSIKSKLDISSVLSQMRRPGLRSKCSTVL